MTDINSDQEKIEKIGKLKRVMLCKLEDRNTKQVWEGRVASKGGSYLRCWSLGFVLKLEKGDRKDSAFRVRKQTDLAVNISEQLRGGGEGLLGHLHTYISH